MAYEGPVATVGCFFHDQDDCGHDGALVDSLTGPSEVRLLRLYNTEARADLEKELIHLTD